MTKSKSVRETRTMYRTRATKSRLLPATKPRTLKNTSPRQTATWKQLLRWQVWLNEHESEFEKKNPGQYLAIWDEQVVAVGNTWGETHRAATAAMPNVIPLITYIPRAEDLPAILTPFPVEWAK